jgi:putative heme transporter
VPGERPDAAPAGEAGALGTRRPRSPSTRLRLVLRIALAPAIVLLAYALVLPMLSDYGSVWGELRALTPAWIAAIAAATALNVVTYAFPWTVLLPQLTFGAAIRLTQASTALITVLPGGAPMGMAISFGILRSFGVSSDAGGFAVALTGIWNQVAVFLFPVAGLALVAADGSVSRPIVWIAAVGAVLAAAIVAVTAFAFADEERARRFGNLLGSTVRFARRAVRRGPPSWDGDALVRLRREGLRMVSRSWLALTLATLANQLTGYLMLDLSLRAVGIGFAQLSIPATFAAWSLGRLVGSLPLTPGGIGLVELSLVGTLLGFGGPNAQVVAGVLLYRAAIVVPTLVLGGVALTWRRPRRPDAPAPEA